MIDALAPINPAVPSPGQSCSKAGFLMPAAVFASRFETFRFDRTSFHPAAVFPPIDPWTQTGRRLHQGIMFFTGGPTIKIGLDPFRGLKEG